MKKIVAVALLAASAVASANSDTDALMATLKTKFPTTRTLAVETTPIPGIFEVTMGKNVVYTEKTAHYFLFGNLYDMEKREDLTQGKREEANKIDVSVLPMKDAFVRVKGNGARKLYLFTDPDCPYCKRLEQGVLPQLDNVTIYTFMFPIAQLHPKATAKSEAVWCQPAKMRASAWEDLVLRSKEAPAKSCANPLAEIRAVGERLGITGTPTMIRSDGAMQPGALPADRLDAWLNQSK